MTNFLIDFGSIIVRLECRSKLLRGNGANLRSSMSSGTVVELSKLLKYGDKHDRSGGPKFEPKNHVGTGGAL